MKNITTILLAFLVFLSAMHFTLSAHYCGGEIAAVKLSLSGKTASCGMEPGEHNKAFPGTRISSRCCEDESIIYSVDNQYAPSKLLYRTIPENLIQDFNITTILTYHYSNQSIASNFATGSPPGNLMTSAVNVSEICVFRI